jgi:hypothetical protein
MPMLLRLSATIIQRLIEIKVKSLNILRSKK